jgi:hypothetical protein
LEEQVNKKNKIRITFTLAAAALSCITCHVDKPTVSYKTKNVIIFMIDGPRYSETWGDPTHQYIPNLASIVNQGVFCTSFYNDGVTNTVNGHSAITTGYFDNLNNAGQQLPENPSIFQYWLEKTGAQSNRAWVISTKDKLEVLANCTDPAYHDKFLARTNCGVNGLNTGYREDTTTFRILMDVLQSYHPNLLLVNFKQPDAAGHANDWPGYIQGIRQTDIYMKQVWDFIQSDPAYAGTTTIFMTNDHGRHLDSVPLGFITHGDNCDGCRHINLFAAGPDFKTNTFVSTRYTQVDITATIAELLGLRMPHSNGHVMKEFFR